MTSSSGRRSPWRLGLGALVTALLLGLPLWLFPLLSVTSPSHALQLGLRDGWVQRDLSGNLPPKWDSVRPARGALGSAIYVARRYHLGLALLAVWGTLPLLRRLGAFDPASARAWLAFLLLAGIPCAVLGFVGYRFADLERDALSQTLPLLLARPRVAGSLCGVGIGLLLTGLRLFRHRSGGDPDAGSSEEPSSSDDSASGSNGGPADAEEG